MGSHRSVPARLGTDEYTHFVTAQYSVDYFEPSFIDGKCAPLKR